MAEELWKKRHTGPRGRFGGVETPGATTVSLQVCAGGTAYSRPIKQLSANLVRPTEKFVEERWIGIVKQLSRVGMIAEI